MRGESPLVALVAALEYAGQSSMLTCPRGNSVVVAYSLRVGDDVRQRMGPRRVGTVRGSTQGRALVIALREFGLIFPYHPLHAAATSVLLYGLQAIGMADGNH